jgi:hypothetical protein
MSVGNEVGTVDIFEEVPAILVVVVGIFIFLMTIAEGFISYSERKEEDHLTRQLVSFCDSVLSSEALLFDSEQGRFDSFRLDTEGRERLHDSFRPDVLGFHYNVTITDVSLYVEKYNWSAGERIGESVQLRTTSVPVIISNGYGQHHPAWMTVTIWEA